MNKTEQSMLPSLLKFFSDRAHFEVLKEFKMTKQVLCWFIKLV